LAPQSCGFSGSGGLLALDQDAVLEPGAERTRATRWAPVMALQRSWADSTSLNTIARAAAGLPAPRVTLVRSLTVENVDSMGFVVRRWIQCSAGKS
jgi:hypothetical protein